MQNVSVPISRLRSSAGKVIKVAQSSAGPVFVTQGDRAVAVIMDVEEYERTQEEVSILRALVQGELETNGAGIGFDEVFGEADKLLEK